MQTTLLIIFGVILITIFTISVIYNSLISLKNRVDEAWSDIDIQLKRRYDLIPNLIKTVKEYASHEEETFKKVVQARNMAMSAELKEDTKQLAKAENMLSSTLKSIFALSENYPDLKANQNFLELQKELSDTENKIQASRRFYNGNVKDFNTKIQMFPINIIANKLNFENRDYFEIKDEKERENVKIKF